jgi:hypothetical protein
MYLIGYIAILFEIKANVKFYSETKEYAIFHCEIEDYVKFYSKTEGHVKFHCETKE